LKTRKAEKRRGKESRLTAEAAKTAEGEERKGRGDREKNLTQGH